MELLYILALLACPVAMGAMMWIMSKGMMGANKPTDTEDPQAQSDSVEDLRKQQQKLADDIARLEEHDVPAREREPAAKH
ncbi:MAG: hypothetical protein M3370_04670 [Actinomycetota bacterium]|nr:hypothetical protein [Actinomycetota bacterium]